jgi:hypothetical protein
MDEDEWFDRYAPVKNEVTPALNEWRGSMFGTQGADLEFVKKQDPNCVWTLIDNNDGWEGITNGFHVVNRTGYFVTSVPFVGTFLEVTTCDDFLNEDWPDDDQPEGFGDVEALVSDRRPPRM